MDFMKKPPMGGPPPEMPDADISAYPNNKLDLRYGDEHPRQIFEIFYPETG
ncbi:MAG: hypothetical protein J6P94_05570 [Oscillospiraceae bacterium]|nr:hypothetical protein [Oscillospiraceae bacterium]